MGMKIDKYEIRCVMSLFHQSTYRRFICYYHGHLIFFLSTSRLIKSQN